MQFIKLIFFSILMKRRPQGRRKSISTHWQLLQADSKLPNLSPQKASSKVTGFSDNLWPWTIEVAESSSSWSWARSHGWYHKRDDKAWYKDKKRECERSQRSGNRWAIQSNFGWMPPHFPIYVKRWKRVRDQPQISCGLKIFNIDRTLVNKNEPVLYHLKDGPKRGFVGEELQIGPPGIELPSEEIHWFEKN